MMLFDVVHDEHGGHVNEPVTRYKDVPRSEEWLGVLERCDKVSDGSTRRSKAEATAVNAQEGDRLPCGGRESAHCVDDFGRYRSNREIDFGPEPPNRFYRI